MPGKLCFSRGTKFKMISLINLMEQKNASYANDMFAVEKNGLSWKHYDECIEEAGYAMHKAAQYVSCTPQTPGNQGIFRQSYNLIHPIWTILYEPYYMAHIAWSMVLFFYI